MLVYFATIKNKQAKGKEDKVGLGHRRNPLGDSSQLDTQTNAKLKSEKLSRRMLALTPIFLSPS